MSVSRLLRWSLVPVLAMACSSDSISAPLRGFVYSAAVAECGPADGPAIAILLAPNPIGSAGVSGPYVRVYVPAQLNQLTAHSWPISTNTEAAAWFHPDASTFEIANTGYLIVTSVEPDNTVTGSVNILFPNAGQIKSEFRAAWLPSRVLCI